MNSRQRFIFRVSLFIGAGIKGFGAVYVVANGQTTPGQLTVGIVLGIGSAFEALAASMLPSS